MTSEQPSSDPGVTSDPGASSGAGPAQGGGTHGVAHCSAMLNVARAVCDVAEARATRASAMWQTLGPLVVAGVSQLAAQQVRDAVTVVAAAGVKLGGDPGAKAGEAAGRAVKALGEAWVANTKEAARWASLWRP